MKREPIGYIYMFTNRINGKKYIGQHEYKNGIDENYFGSGSIFAHAKEKYGIENFKFDILCWCNTREELDNAESYFIGFKYYTYANTGRGYNIADGGNGGNLLRGKTEEEKKEIANKISKANTGENNHMYGRTGEKNPNSKPVIGVNLKTGEVIELYGAKQGEELGFIPTAITACCKGKLKQYKDYKWYYKEDYEKLSKEDMEKDLEESRNARSEGNKKMSIPVIGVNIKTGETVELGSTRQGKELGFNQSHITKCCKGKYKTHKGYKFYYKEDYLKLQQTETIEINLNLLTISNINISI